VQFSGPNRINLYTAWDDEFKSKEIWGLFMKFYHAEGGMVECRPLDVDPSAEIRSTSRRTDTRSRPSDRNSTLGI
jgi:hypothetical protein